MKVTILLLGIFITVTVTYTSCISNNFDTLYYLENDGFQSEKLNEIIHRFDNIPDNFNKLIIMSAIKIH